MDQIPLILSLETATPICSVALHQGKKLLGTIELHSPRSHNDQLHEMITALMRMMSVEIQQLSCVAISRGPGSYTGLRIGAALAKGICYGQKIPLVSINSLVTMIASSLKAFSGEKARICALLDAKRGFAYGLETNEQGTILKKTYTCQVTKQVFDQSNHQLPIYFLGNSAEQYAQVLETKQNHKVIKGIYAQAQHMGPIAYKKLLAHEKENLESFSPLYLSAFDNAGKNKD